MDLWLSIIIVSLFYDSTLSFPLVGDFRPAATVLQNSEISSESPIDDLSIDSNATSFIIFYNAITENQNRRHRRVAKRTTTADPTRDPILATGIRRPRPLQVPAWAIVLIVVGLLVVIGSIAAFWMRGQMKRKKTFFLNRLGRRIRRRRRKGKKGKKSKDDDSDSDKKSISDDEKEKSLKSSKKQKVVKEGKASKKAEAKKEKSGKKAAAVSKKGQMAQACAIKKGKGGLKSKQTTKKGVKSKK